jgi:hypothetical protein
LAIDAVIDGFDGVVGLFLLPIVAREKDNDDPDVPGYDTPGYIYYFWDAVKLEEHDEHDFLGVEITNIGHLNDRDLEVMDELDLPRVNVPEAGIVNGTVGDVFRWARQVYLSRYSATSA